MAYNLEGIFQAVRDIPRGSPSLSLSELSQQLRVERHTIERSVRDRTGDRFREFRRSLLIDAATRRLSADPSRSVKEVAAELAVRPQCWPEVLRGFTESPQSNSDKG